MKKSLQICALSLELVFSYGGQPIKYLKMQRRFEQLWYNKHFFLFNLFRFGKTCCISCFFLNYIVSDFKKKQKQNIIPQRAQKCSAGSQEDNVIAFLSIATCDRKSCFSGVLVFQVLKTLKNLEMHRVGVCK